MWGRHFANKYLNSTFLEKFGKCPEELGDSGSIHVHTFSTSCLPILRLLRSREIIDIKDEVKKADNEMNHRCYRISFFSSFSSFPSFSSLNFSSSFPSLDFSSLLDSLSLRFPPLVSIFPSCSSFSLSSREGVLRQVTHYVSGSRTSCFAIPDFAGK